MPSIPTSVVAEDVTGILIFDATFIIAAPLLTTQMYNPSHDGKVKAIFNCLRIVAPQAGSAHVRARTIAIKFCTATACSHAGETAAYEMDFRG